MIFTCGGTAGHVNPAIALAQLMREKDPETEFLFVGAERGLEKDLIPKAGYDFRTVHISSFHRSFKPREIRHNLISVGNLLRSPREARRILRDFRPDVVIGTGGYASFPLVKAASQAGFPTAVHESNIVPGLTTEMLEPFADRILVGFEACRQHYKHPEKVVVTGTPVRGEFFQITRQQARDALGIKDDRPLVLSYWGSLGAEVMNGYMVDFLRQAARDGAPFHHIHGAGRNFAAMEQALAAQGFELHPVLEVGNTDVITRFLLDNEGISFLPEYVVREHLRNGRLVILDTQCPDIPMWSQLVYHRNKFVSPQMRVFLQLLSGSPVPLD